MKNLLAPESGNDPRWRWLVGATLVGFAIAAFWGRQRGIYWGGDDADYVLLARALRDFRYHDLFLVGTPPHVTYPPVFPALLLVWGTVLGETLSTLSTLSVLLTVTAIGIIAHLVATHSSRRFAALVTLLVAINPHVLEYGGRILSEAPMLFFGAATFWFAVRTDDTRATVGAIACAVLCALSRSAGVAVIGGVVVAWFFQGRRRDSIVLAAVAAVFVGAWTLWANQDVSGGATAYGVQIAAGYTDQELPFWQALLQSVTSKWASILGGQMAALFALPVSAETQLDNIAWAALTIGAMTIGLWPIARKVPALGLAVLAYAAILTVWPFSGMRLLLPFVAVFYVAVLAGTWRVASLLGRPVANGAFAAVFLLLFVSAAVRAGPAIGCDGSVFSETPECVSDAELGLGRAIAWVGESVPDESVVMVRRGEVTHFYTDLPTVRLPGGGDLAVATTAEIMAERDPDYILAAGVYPGRRGALNTFLSDHCQQLRTVYRDGGHTYVFEVRAPAATDSGNACEDVAAFVSDASD